MWFFQTFENLDDVRQILLPTGADLQFHPTGQFRVAESRSNPRSVRSRNRRGNITPCTPSFRHDGDFDVPELQRVPTGVLPPHHPKAKVGGERINRSRFSRPTTMSMSSVVAAYPWRMAASPPTIANGIEQSDAKRSRASKALAKRLSSPPPSRAAVTLLRCPTHRSAAAQPFASTFTSSKDPNQIPTHGNLPFPVLLNPRLRESSASPPLRVSIFTRPTRAARSLKAYGHLPLPETADRASADAPGRRFSIASPPAPANPDRFASAPRAGGSDLWPDRRPAS